jgi:anti-sigma-K factor RskA
MQQTYQLWGIRGGSPISLGLLGNAPGTVALNVDSHARDSTFAITAEPSGGSIAPTKAPIAQGSTRA